MFTNVHNNTSNSCGAFLLKISTAKKKMGSPNYINSFGNPFNKVNVNLIVLLDEKSMNNQSRVHPLGTINVWTRAMEQNISMAQKTQ